MEIDNTYFMNMEVNLFGTSIGKAKVVYEVYKDEITNAILPGYSDISSELNNISE